MDTVEHLREALFELNQKRNRDLEKLTQSQAVLAGLEKIAAAESPTAALDALLTSVRSSTDCDAAVLLECVGSNCHAIASTDPDLGDCSNVNAEFISKRNLRIVNLSAVSEQAYDLSRNGQYRSMISAPFEVKSDEALVLVCLSREHAKLSARHQTIAARLIALAAQTLATKKLADENSLLAAVLNRSSASFSIANADDPEARLIYVNDAFEKLTGYSSTEVLGKNCRFLSAEESDAKIRADIRTTINQRSVGQFEVRNKRKNGDVFWNNLSIFPVEAGNNTYVVATQWDLSARINAEEERDFARKQLVSALASVKEGILLLDPEDRVVFTNDGYQKFHNLGKDALPQGADFVQAWAAAKERQGHSKENAHLNGLEVLRKVKKPCIQRDLTLPSGLQVLETNAQTSVGGTVSVLSDVTPLKVAQKQLSERVAAIDSVQDGIAITDMDGRFIYLNPSHISMFGYAKASQLIGRKWSVLYDADQMSFINEVAIPGMMKSGQWRGDVLGRRKDGTPVSQEVTLTQLVGSGLICVTRDITERIQNEAERAALRDQLHAAQRQEAIGQMAAGLAHDFNNCLSVMSGSAALVQESRSESERDLHAQRIIDSGAKAAELTGRLLRFGARNSQRSALDIRDPIRSAFDLVRSSLRADINLVLDMPREPIICEIDPTDVLQVILNLVINARDALTNRAGTIYVSLEKMDGACMTNTPILGQIDPQSEYAVVQVEDNGSGIEVDDLDSLFEAYMTTKADQGGTGLGLSVVRSLLQANNGSIDLSSRPKEGTKFSIFWPLKSMQIQSRSAVSNAYREVDLKGVKVIVVDDDQQVAETIATFLEHAGCEVVICDEPQEAVLVVREEPTYWDVIVTDYDMPQMTGAALAQEIRNIAKQLPIILVTAVPEYMGGERAGSKLFNARLSKPIDAKRLISEVGRTIGR